MPTKATTEQVKAKPELVRTADLHAHPRNYRAHPLDQIEHLAASITQHGLYRNIVVARDLTILAGHGIWLACQQLGMEIVPVARLDPAPNSPAALKILTADNALSHLALDNDRALAHLLTGRSSDQGVQSDE